MGQFRRFSGLAEMCTGTANRPARAEHKRQRLSASPLSLMVFKDLLLVVFQNRLIFDPIVGCPRIA
jgi:hypothetical protein